MCMKTRLWWSSLKTDVDLISFQELTPEWASILKRRWLPTIPHHYQSVGIDPMARNILFTLSHSHHRYTQWLLCFDVAPGNQNGQKLHLVSTYLTSLNGKYLALPEPEKHQPFCGLPPQKTIVLGEFNMVWSDEIRQFRENHPPAQFEKRCDSGILSRSFDHRLYAEDLQCVALKDLMLSKRQNWHLRSLPAKSGSCQIGSQVLLMESPVFTVHSTIYLLKSCMHCFNSG